MGQKASRLASFLYRKVFLCLIMIWKIVKSSLHLSLFHEDGTSNLTTLPALIRHLLHHTDGILLLRNDGQLWPTMRNCNSLRPFKDCQWTGPLILWYRNNETRDSIEFVKEVDAFGGFTQDYYRPLLQQTIPRRMYQHSKTIGPSSATIIYTIFQGNVVVEMTPEAMLRLAEHPNIIGVRVATTLANMAYLINTSQKNFSSIQEKMGCFPYDEP